VVTDCNYYRFGNSIIKVESEHDLKYAFNKNVQKFECEFHGEPDIYIKHIFDKRSIKSIWSAYKTIFKNENWVIQRSSKDIYYHYLPSNVKAISNISGTHWEILVPDKMREYYYSNKFRDIGLFYSDQIIMYPYILKNNGTFIHGNGLFKNDKGILLIGDSGAGKTTLTKMLMEDGWTLLCDDRTIVIDDMIYGHWCHGSYDNVTNSQHKLTHVYNLIQGPITYTECMKEGWLIFAKHSIGHLDWNLPYNVEIYNNLSGLQVKFINLSFNLSGDVVDIIEREQ